MTTPTAQLSEAGVSIWLDDLSRELIESGALAALVANRDVVGVTTNPTIFAGALANGAYYAEQIASLAARGVSAADAVFEITTDDVRAGCDVLRPVFESSGRVDGRVSIEVSPDLAHDVDSTVAEAKALVKTIDRENALVKIPATLAGVTAIEECIAAGISVNVTLIFSLERYRAVIAAYLNGLRKALEAGIDISAIHSVASFFVSRVDTEVDARLDAIGGDAAESLKSKAGLANARLAYELFEESFSTDDAKELLAAGANLQRPLWASTGVKNPALPDTLYVTGLVARGVVNTMPDKTLEATFDHAEITGDTITPNYADSHRILAELASLGIEIDDVTRKLEEEGVAKFIVSWDELLTTVTEALDAAKAKL